MKVLIVDKDYYVRESLAACIDWESYGFDTVYLAKNGLEAVSTAQLTPPDLVVTEVDLPYMDGIKLTGRLKSIKEDIFVILISDVRDDHYMKAAIHLDAFEYLLKPISLNELRDSVYRAKIHIFERRASAAGAYVRIPRDPNTDIGEEIYEKSGESSDLEVFSFCNISEFIDAIGKGDTELAMSVFAEKRGKLVEKTSCPSIVLHMFCSNLFNACENEIKQLGGDTFEVFESPVDMLHTISSQHYVDSTLAMLEQALKEMLAYIRKLSTKANNSDIEKAKEFIDNNYFALDISLNGVAKLINMNPAYFSVLFKRNVGMTFINYLTQVRINKSCELLSKTNMKIYEVAYAVGYDNPTYFSTVFKKNTGCSPQDYRKNKNTAIKV